MGGRGGRERRDKGSGGEGEEERGRRVGRGEWKRRGERGGEDKG